MSHIRVPEGLPGLLGLMAFKPTTGARLADLIRQILCGDGPLSRTERELIAAYVSALNSGDSANPTTGSDAHATGDDELGSDADGVDPRLRALLRLAAAVVAGGRQVTDDDISAARAAGSTDEEIHDTVLLAATFCMISRYVDGLGIPAPYEGHVRAREDSLSARRHYRPA